MLDFASYSKDFINLYDEEIPSLLADALTKSRGAFSLLDLGCGDGSLLFGLYKNGYFSNAGRVAGVDLSPERLARLASHNIPKIEIACSDASNVKQFDSSSFDYVLSTQVIEHVPDDKKMLAEINRLLKKNGIAYIASVVKKKYAWYVHRCNGKWTLDPTHVREYPSGKVFADMIDSTGMEPIELKLTPYRFTPMDFFIRRIYFPFARSRDVNSFFLRHKKMNNLRRLQIPVPGYFIVEVLARKK